jgi:hypothetical protein
MTNGSRLFYAVILFIGFSGAAFAETQRDTDRMREQGMSGRSSGGDAAPSYSPGNPTPNNRIGDQPSSGDDKRGYDSDDAH